MKTIQKYLDSELAIAEHADQKMCSILIKKESLLDWIAILWLTLEDLGLAIVIFANKSKCVLQSSKGKTWISEDAGPIRVKMSKDNILVLGSFLLGYYRDGFADVDHIDFEASFSNTSSGYLTFKVEKFKPSVTEGEARRILGI